MSMGTIVSVMAFPHIKNQVDFIIGDSFVTDPAEIVDYYKVQGKEILLPRGNQTFRSALESIDCPILILAAKDDAITTYSSAMEMKEKLGENCQVVLYEGGHLTGFQVNYESKGFGGWFLIQVEGFLVTFENG